MGSFLQDIFSRFGGTPGPWDNEDNEEASAPSCSSTLVQAIEHVVDGTYSRLRFLSGYARRLREPVEMALQYINTLVEGVPEAILCSRAAFSEDPRVNAFFADPNHLQQVFSYSAEVHDLLEANPKADACWALLCMKIEEHRQLGVALVGDTVRKDVMQTTVNFTDHQVLSSATTETRAKCSLKCCIFDGLLTYIRERARDDNIRVTELENRRDFLVTRLHQNAPEGSDDFRAALEREIAEIGETLAQEIPRLASLESHLKPVVDVLRNPACYVSGHLRTLHLSRMGIKLAGGRADTGNQVPLFEIQIAGQGTRIGALVRFPRAELLPRQDLVCKADLFLTL